MIQVLAATVALEVLAAASIVWPAVATALLVWGAVILFIVDWLLLRACVANADAIRRLRNAAR